MMQVTFEELGKKSLAPIICINIQRILIHFKICYRNYIWNKQLYFQKPANVAVKAEEKQIYNLVDIISSATENEAKHDQINISVDILETSAKSIKYESKTTKNKLIYEIIKSTEPSTQSLVVEISTKTMKPGTMNNISSLPIVRNSASELPILLPGVLLLITSLIIILGGFIYKGHRNKIKKFLQSFYGEKMPKYFSKPQGRKIHVGILKPDLPVLVNNRFLFFYSSIDYLFFNT